MAFLFPAELTGGAPQHRIAFGRADLVVFVRSTITHHLHQRRAVAGAHGGSSHLPRNILQRGTLVPHLGHIVESRGQIMHLGRLDKAARYFLPDVQNTADCDRLLPLQVRKLSAALHLIDAGPLMANFWLLPSASAARTHGSESSPPVCREGRGCVLRVWPSSSGCCASRERPHDAGGCCYTGSQEAIVDARGKPT